MSQGNGDDIDRSSQVPGFLLTSQQAYSTNKSTSLLYQQANKLTLPTSQQAYCPNKPTSLLYQQANKLTAKNSGQVTFIWLFEQVTLISVVRIACWHDYAD